MIQNDFSSLSDIHSMIISGSQKHGKTTFLLYLIAYFYKEKALFFTTQEKYIFQKKIATLSKQFKQFEHIKGMLDVYFLREDFTKVKQKYGYTFLLEEMEKTILQSNEKIIVIHHIEDFFDFQDRYEINNFYKTLVKITETHDKKIIFIANERDDNFKHIEQVSQEFTDVSIEVSKNEKNERILNIMNMLHHKEYPTLRFSINESNFLLEYLKDIEANNNTQHIKNILIAELDPVHDNINQILTYIFDKSNFIIKNANSLQGMLQEIFIRPDLILILMKREKQNLETIKAIKMQLPNTSILVMLDQPFVRSEDIHEIFSYGADEVLPNSFTFNTLILTLEKIIHSLFYTDTLHILPKHKNILKNLNELKTLAEECIEKSIFFTAFVIESKTEFPKIRKTSRKTDYLYQEKNRMYYLAINTIPRDIFKITEKFKKTNPDLHYRCVWEPINSAHLEECIK